MWYNVRRGIQKEVRMFVGRENDLEELMALWRKRTSSLAVVSGRRRIGKSTLVERFAADSKCRFIEIAGD